MTINDKGLDLIKHYEGFRPTAYKCSAGVWTIGYGHTKGVRQGDTCTMDEATLFLKADVREAENAVSRLVTVPLTSNQFSALVSFVFNIGSGAFGTSTLLCKLNAGAYHEVPGEMMRWNKAGGKILAGLNKRRAAEAALFVSAD